MSQGDLFPPSGAGLPSRDTYAAAEASSEKLSNKSDQQQLAVENVRASSPTLRRDSLSERENVRPNTNSSRSVKKTRRGKKRKWKPYSKLTWVERKQLQDREEKRAEKVRADMCASGLTLAPYNTTQFLMDDHNVREPDYDHIPVGNRLNPHHHHAKDLNGSNNVSSQDSSDDYYSSPEDEEDFLQQQFTETYKSIHAERLSNMSQSELVNELMGLEDRVETLQNALKASDGKTETVDDPLKHKEQLQKIRVFEVEIRKLTEQNDRLRRENADLKLMLQSGVDRTS